jgi:hypothetical protein
MKSIFSILLLLFIQISSNAMKDSDSSLLLTLNQQIDNDVVAQNLDSLKAAYADDFVFSHGSGRIEGKAGWLTSVKKGGFQSRLHDSVRVELHPDIAILRGKLKVIKKSATKTDRYYLYYIRVFVYREKRWQLISHMTTSEFHEPAG